MLKETKYLLDDINGYPLDKSQRIAVLTDEISNLVVAGAGSGKTLTIIGKIRYLVECKGIRLNEILCISFTRDATNSLKEKLKNVYNYNVDVYTFHKLALKFIKDKRVCSNSLLEYIVDEYFYLLDDKKLIKHNNPQFKKLIISFINLFKANGHKIEKFLKISNKNNKDMLSIIINIYLIYENELKSTDSVDFNDLIILATDYVNNNEIDCNYKYIIIDEYQDTSYIRYLFIKSIIDKTNAKLMVVGDDWQSIYRFTGCDLNMFINFRKYFKKCKILFIKNTYRNSLELIKVSHKFITKNKSQINKKLNSNKRLTKPLKFIKEEPNILEKLLCYMEERGLNDIFILGRNNYDINRYLTKNMTISELGIITYRDLKIRYLTVHKSKGLECDNVILINLVDDTLGFPSKIKEDELLNLITDNKKRYMYDEERRLFYVALTRTKNNVFFLIPKKKSIFIRELESDNQKYIEYLSI